MRTTLSVVAIVACGCGSAQTPEDSPEPAAITIGEPVVSILAASLGSEFAENRIAAENLFVGNAIRVAGIVESIGRDVLGQPYAILSGPRPVQCVFSDDDEVLSLVTGAPAIIVGICTGETLGAVLLDPSRVEPSDVESIAASDMSLSDRMLFIALVEPLAAGWLSDRWQRLVPATPQEIRATEAWKTFRAEERR